MSKFSFEIQEGPARMLVTVIGELDLTAADDLVAGCEEAMPPSPRAVVVDLRRVDFIDSAGLRALLSISEEAGELGHPFALVRGNRQVQRLLELTRVSQQVTLIDDPGELFVA